MPKSELILKRFTNHFHNPLKSIWDAGYNIFPFTGYSSILWAQKTAGEQESGGNYSWMDARQTFYEALTSTDNSVRDERFAQTFRSLGQVMHLVQDMSAPAHTRNDFHNAYNYEDRIKSLENDPGMSEWIAAGKDHLFPIEELNQSSSFAEAPVPIARLFDGNHYDGSNPLVTLQSNIGLAEFTHANFVSADTLPVADTGDTPNLEESCIATVYREVPDMFHFDGYSYVERPYYTRTLGCETDGEAYLLAGVDFFTFVNGDQDESSTDSQLVVIPPMDDNVYDSYAEHLIPRAVGYSSTLLHYFFRGDLVVQGHEIPDPVGNRIGMQFSVENKTPYESIVNGDFIVAYQYLPANSDEAVRGLSSPAVTGVLESAGNPGVYIVTFDRTIPADARNVSYQLIYRGRLGFEDGAVAVSQVDLLAPVFREDWSAGLAGSNPWSHTGIDLPGPPASSGTVTNETDSAFFYKENTRHAGVMTNQVNESIFTPAAPVSISSNAKIGLKVDAMQIQPVLEPQTCAENPWNLPAYQKVQFEFLLGDGTQRSFHYSVDGQHDFGSRMTLTEQYHWFDNIYWVLDQLGPVAEPVRLNRVKVVQNLMPLCEQQTVPQTQNLQVDYIRIVDTGE